MTAEADRRIEKEVQQSLNAPQHDLSQVYSDIFNRPGHNIEDSSLIAANKALHDNGFPDLDIVGIDNKNHILTVDKDSKELQFRDAGDFDNIASSKDFNSLGQEVKNEVTRIIAMDSQTGNDPRHGEQRRSQGVLYNPRGDAFTNDEHGWIDEFQYSGAAHSYKLTNTEMYNLTGAAAIQTPDGKTFTQNGESWEGTDANGKKLGQFKLGIITVNENGIEADGPDAGILNLPKGLKPVAAANPK